MKPLIIGALVGACCLASGCAGLGVIHNKCIVTEIVSQPVGATIFIGDKIIGKTPLKTHIERSYNTLVGAWQEYYIKAVLDSPGLSPQYMHIGWDEPTPKYISFDMSKDPRTNGGAPQLCVLLPPDRSIVK